MQWIKKEDPAINETRVLKRFAVLPNLMTDQKTVVWLEHFEVRQVYMLVGMFTGHCAWRDDHYSAIPKRERMRLKPRGEAFPQ